MVGTPRRYFGEFGPEAVDVTIVFTGSALTDGGGLTLSCIFVGTTLGVLSAACCWPFF